MIGRLQTKADRAAARWAPKESREVMRHDDGSIVYAYESGGAPYAIAYRGTAGRPTFHTRYSTDEQRDRDVAAFRSGLDASAARKSAQRAERAAWRNPIRVGDLFVTSWGYDQTNVSFYGVISVSGRAVTLRPVAAETVPESEGRDCCRLRVAQPLRYVGPEQRKIAQPSGPAGAYLVVAGHTASATDATRSHYASWYA